MGMGIYHHETGRWALGIAVVYTRAQSKRVDYLAEAQASFALFFSTGDMAGPNLHV